jgi:septum formation inhibitor-activating ATPase MinD
MSVSGVLNEQGNSNCQSERRGVGKTTTVINFAAGLAHIWGRNVC